MIYVLDASAVLRFLDRETGAAQVSEIFERRALGEARVVISAIQWGEIASITYRRESASRVNETLARLISLGVEVVPVPPPQAVRAGILQNTLKLPYADAFAVALTEQMQGAVLVTADFDFKGAEGMVAIDFLPPKTAIQTKS